MRASTSPPTRSACAAASATCPSTTACPLDQTAADVVSTFGELSGLPPRAARQRASDVLDLVGLDEARFRPVGGFSTGMRQRTKLAQAIVADPELVLLDEPTAGLDPLGREEMLDLVARLGGLGISVLLATHLLDDVQQVCDHVVMLDGGHLVVVGRHRLAPRAHRPAHRRRRRRPRRRSSPASPSAGSPATTEAGLVEVQVDGDDDIDTVRDAVADLGLPLHRMTTRLTSLDEVFLDRAGTGLMTGAVYDRGLPRLRGRAWRARRRPGGAVPRLRAPRPRAAAAVAPEGGAVRAARHRRRSRRSSTSASPTSRGTPPASDFEFITYRDYVGVSNILLVFVALTAPDIVCPDRRQHVLPLLFARPLTGVDYVLAKVGAMFAILFAFSFLPQVVLFVGQMLVSDDGALRYARDNAEVMWQVPVAVALLSLFYASIGVAVASLTSRRIIAGASIIGLVPRDLDRRPRPGRAADEPRVRPGRRVLEPADHGGHRGRRGHRGPGADGARRRRGARPRPRAQARRADRPARRCPLVLRDLVFLGEVDDTHPMSGLANGGLYAVHPVHRVRRRRALVTLFVRYDEVER